MRNGEGGEGDRGTWNSSDQSVLIACHSSFFPVQPKQRATHFHQQSLMSPSTAAEPVFFALFRPRDKPLSSFSSPSRFTKCLTCVAYWAPTSNAPDAATGRHAAYSNRDPVSFAIFPSFFFRRIRPELIYPAPPVPISDYSAFRGVEERLHIASCRIRRTPRLFTMHVA